MSDADPWAPVRVPLKVFLLTEQRCPPEWYGRDLYLFRDGDLVWYVGQSYAAFNRVWEHLLGGFKGRSTVGRFILCNWPAAMNFEVELWDSRAPRFAAVQHGLDAAERALIEEYAPCFNTALNRTPTPVPPGYALPNAVLKTRSLSRLIREARYAVQAEQRRQWLAEGQE